MGIARTFPAAYAKTREAVENKLPEQGSVFISVCDRDKRAIAPVAMALENLGYGIYTTGGTAKTLRAAGIDCTTVNRISDGHPNVVDLMRDKSVSFIINTPHGHEAHSDGAKMRAEAVSQGITCVTAMSAATALIQALAAARKSEPETFALQDL